MRQLIPTVRGFVLGVALWAATASQGCSFDTGRMSIDPETGETLVEKAGKLVPPKPSEAGFVGPVDPLEGHDLLKGLRISEQSFTDGKRAAKADFNKTVSWATGIALWIFIPLAIIVALASFVVPWIPTKAAIYCAVSACAVVGIRYALLVFGTIAVDWAVYISVASAVVVALVVGLPMVIAWAKRKTWKRATALAEEGSHVEAAVALAATVDPAVDKIRKQVDEWLEVFHKGDKASSVWHEAKMQLVKIGLVKP